MARFKAIGRLVHVGVRDSANNYVLHLEKYLKNKQELCLITEESDDGNWKIDSRYEQIGSDEEVISRIQYLWSKILEEATEEVFEIGGWRLIDEETLRFDPAYKSKPNTKPESRVGSQLNQFSPVIRIYTRLPYYISGDGENGSNCENFAAFILEGHTTPRWGQFITWLEEGGINTEPLIKKLSSFSSLDSKPRPSKPSIGIDLKLINLGSINLRQG